MKKKISFILTIALIVFLPSLAVAQTTDTSDASTSTTIIDTTTDTTVAFSTSSPQQSTTSQDTINAPDLEGTTNPQEGSSTGDTIVVPPATDTSTSTPADHGDIVIVPSAPVSTTTSEVQIPVTDDSVDVVSDVTASTTDSIAELPAEALIPTQEYTFSLSGESIATQKTPDWNQDASSTPNSDATVSATPSLDASDANTLTVSGQCSDPYFVVLLYKNEEDYNDNPSSYIFNKAFPCENGEYSYPIAELPFNLKSGRFYLLVAGQGAVGSWKPITALIPVGITVTTTYTTASSTVDDSVNTTN